MTCEAYERQVLIRRLCRVARDRDHAEDLLQSAFVRLAEFRRHSVVINEAGFLVQAATNIAIDEGRRARTRSEVANGMERLLHLSDEQPLQDEILLAQERLATVRAALLELMPRTRSIFEMHRFANVSHRDIAGRLGISISAVEKHIARATLYIANRLDDEATAAPRLRPRKPGAPASYAL